MLCNSKRFVSFFFFFPVHRGPLTKGNQPTRAIQKERDEDQGPGKVPTARTWNCAVLDWATRKSNDQVSRHERQPDCQTSPRCFGDSFCLLSSSSSRNSPWMPFTLLPDCCPEACMVQSGEGRRSGEATDMSQAEDREKREQWYREGKFKNLHYDKEKGEEACEGGGSF